MTTPSYIAAADGTKLAFYATPAGEGRAGPGIVFLGGFMSDMTGEKATTLEAWAKRAGHAYLRLDYSGHGDSGGEFRDGTVGRWADDALTVINHAGHAVAGHCGQNQIRRRLHLEMFSKVVFSTHHRIPSPLNTRTGMLFVSLGVSPREWMANSWLESLP